jgi:hypothetical protein
VPVVDAVEVASAVTVCENAPVPARSITAEVPPAVVVPAALQ